MTQDTDTTTTRLSLLFRFMYMFCLVVLHALVQSSKEFIRFPLTDTNGTRRSHIRMRKVIGGATKAKEFLSTIHDFGLCPWNDSCSTDTPME